MFFRDQKATMKGHKTTLLRDPNVAHLQMHTFLRHIQSLPAHSSGTFSTDQQLLQQFNANGDQVAFAELVGRHGQLVLSVCSRVLCREQDAEDAFQVTFLVLARKSTSIRKGESLASWLHGVAWRSAARLRDELAERRRHESRLAPPKAQAPPDPSWREVQEVLHQELARLPDAYRAPLVLCYLEGKTQCEAATLLGWGEHVLRGRLDRGRERLQRRLAQRGITLSAALLAAAVSQGGPVSAALVRTTARMAIESAGAPIEAVVKAVCRGLLLSRPRLAGLLLTVATALGAVAGLLAMSGPQDKQEHALTDPPPRAEQEATAPRTDCHGDPLPAGALARLGTRRFRHDYELRALVFGPRDRTLFSAGSDRIIRVWDVASGKNLARMTGHSAQINALALSPDGKLLASAGNDRTVRLWDPAGSAEVRRLEGHEGDVTRVAFAPDCKILASAGTDKTIRIWDIATGRQLRQLAGHQVVHSLGFAPDGKTLACGGYDPARAAPSQTTVLLWDVASGTQRRQHDGYSSHVFAQGRKTLVTMSSEHLRLWDVVAGTSQRDLPAPSHKQDPATGLGVGWQLSQSPIIASPDGKTIAVLTMETSEAAFAGQVVRLWDLETGKVKHALEHTHYGVDALAFSGDGNTLAIGPGHGAISLWDVATGKQRNANGHDGPAMHVAFSPDGKKIVSGSDDWKCRLWDAATGAELRRFDCSDMVTGFALSPDGRTLVTACGATVNTFNPSLCVWDLETARLRGEFKIDTGKGGPFRYAAACCAAFAPDGKSFTFASHDKKVRTWDTASLEEKRSFEVEESVFRLCFSPDCHSLACNGTPGTVLLRDSMTGQEVLRLKDHAHEEPVAFAFSPDGRLLATVDGRDVRVWEMVTGRERLRLPMRAGLPFVVFSPDSRWLAAGGDPGRTVCIWNVSAGQEVLRLSGHERGLTAAAFAPDGQRLATASHDTTVLIWDLAGRLKLKQTDLPGAGRDELWTWLADPDPAKAQRALRLLIGAGDRGVAFLAARLKPAAWDATHAARFKQFIADLDSDTYAARESATEELSRFGDRAQPSLREVLRAAPSAETRRRVETLLVSLQVGHFPAEMLRELRGLEVLERVNTPAARQQLERLAMGLPRTRLTQEARKSLDRLRVGSR
jgi:RNA polymerase sigma factor (sigma-70 family)